MKNKKIILLCIVIFTTFLYLGIKSIRSTVVFKKKDRINVVIYSKSPVFYSIAINEVSYFIPFIADYEMLIPGGYGMYRLGALGKLVHLEKKPDLIQKTFSSATSSFVDLYFYPPDVSVYYGNVKQPSVFPKPQDIFLSRTNGSWIDRFVIFTLFTNRNKNKYKIIQDLPVIRKNSTIIFDRDKFFKKYQGFLYKKTYRTLNETVQILYKHSYSTAYIIDQILEGEGIRVVDISQDDKNEGSCIIRQNTEPDETTIGIADHFQCSYEKGKTQISDIIISLGSLENDWSVK